jgi:rhodanese-related sulfurtransferase
MGRRVGWVLIPLILGSSGCGPSISAIDLEEIAVALKVAAEKDGYTLLNVKELGELVDTRSNMVLVDARPEDQYRERHILGSTSYLFPNVIAGDTWTGADFGGSDPEHFARQLGPNKSVPVIVYDEGRKSPRAQSAARWARKLGYEDVRLLVGGIEAWSAADRETRSLDR